MDWIRDHAWETWLVAAVLLGVAEMVSLDLIFAMLAVGCVVGMVAALVGLPALLAVVLAGGSAVGLLAFLRPNLVRALHAGPELRTGPAALIGQPVKVLSALTSGESGRVKIGGDEWTARCYDELDEIEPGERAEVVEIRGATAYVRRM
ncbi:NfeD family protein [Nocardioides mangrovicus]|uniref:NfeD family protein n=1 Tax=Nocardioides mangrovicus TaxID=2478913 RepID=A0A3L8P2G8_9ACTN|nr:NfeD family protein [Nocardioides mangrovicus]RLV48749.1 NfeD family protein [Nocardioides mangrovicus]